jgi:chlorite dismutase
VHFRPTLEEIAAAQAEMRQLACALEWSLSYSFLSVTEAGLYHLTAQLARDAAARGGAVGDPAYVAELAQRTAAEHDSPHVQRRLFPQLPPDMPYVCFYPMSKRRDEGQNWYQLSLDERSRLMHAHGMTGRRYAGRVLQIITGAIGFDAWEWGVTLFAKDPIDFKKLGDGHALRRGERQVRRIRGFLRWQADLGGRWAMGDGRWAVGGGRRVTAKPAGPTTRTEARHVHHAGTKLCGRRFVGWCCSWRPSGGSSSSAASRS